MFAFSDLGRPWVLSFSEHLVFIYKLNHNTCRQNENKKITVAFVLSIFGKHFNNSNNANQQRYMFVWLEVVKQYVFHICFNFPVNTMIQVRYWASIALYWYILVVLWSAFQCNNSIVSESASVMDQYYTGWCRFHSNIRYRHITVTPVFVFLAMFIEYVIHTHHVYMRMIKLSLCWDRIELIILCIVWDEMKKNYPCQGPQLIMLGPQDTRLGPWLIMSGHRLLMSGLKLPLGVWSGPWDKYVGAPTFYVRAPTCYAGPRDNYVGSPTYYVWDPTCYVWATR